MNETLHWFKADPCAEAPITAVRIQRTSSSYVWVDGRRQPRISSRTCYFPTWDQARIHLQAKAALDVQAAIRALERAERIYQSASALHPPCGPATAHHAHPLNHRDLED